MLVWKVDVLAELKKKGYSTYVLQKEGLINGKNINLIKNGGMCKSILVLERICSLLDKQPASLIKYVKDEE